MSQQRIMSPHKGFNVLEVAETSRVLEQPGAQGGPTGYTFLPLLEGQHLERCCHLNLAAHISQDLLLVLVISR